MKIKSYIPDYEQPIIKRANKQNNKYSTFTDLLFSEPYLRLMFTEKKEKNNA